jgi:hypothetical protein
VKRAALLAAAGLALVFAASTGAALIVGTRASDRSVAYDTLHGVWLRQATYAASVAVR